MKITYKAKLVSLRMQSAFARMTAKTAIYLQDFSFDPDSRTMTVSMNGGMGTLVIRQVIDYFAGADESFKSLKSIDELSLLPDPPFDDLPSVPHAIPDVDSGGISFYIFKLYSIDATADQLVNFKTGKLDPRDWNYPVDRVVIKTAGTDLEYTNWETANPRFPQFQLAPDSLDGCPINLKLTYASNVNNPEIFDHFAELTENGVVRIRDIQHDPLTGLVTIPMRRKEIVAYEERPGAKSPTPVYGDEDVEALVTIGRVKALKIDAAAQPGSSGELCFSLSKGIMIDDEGLSLVSVERHNHQPLCRIHLKTSGFHIGYAEGHAARLYMSGSPVTRAPIERIPSMACCFNGCNHPDDELFPIYFSTFEGFPLELECHAACIDALIPPTARPKFLRCVICGKILWGDLFNAIGIFIDSPVHDPKSRYSVHSACLWRKLTVSAMVAYNRKIRNDSGSTFPPHPFYDSVIDKDEAERRRIEYYRKAWRA